MRHFFLKPQVLQKVLLASEVIKINTKSNKVDGCIVFGKLDAIFPKGKMAITNTNEILLTFKISKKRFVKAKKDLIGKNVLKSLAYTKSAKSNTIEIYKRGNFPVDS